MPVTLKKVTDLPNAGALSAGDIVYVIQNVGGVETDFQTTVGAIVMAAVTAAEAAITVPDPTKVPIHNVSGAYTYDPSDAGKVVRHTDAAATIATIDTQANKAFVVQQVVTLRQCGDGQLTITPVTGVTLNVPNGYHPATRAKGSTAMIQIVDANTWDLTGDLAVIS